MARNSNTEKKTRNVEKLPSEARPRFLALVKRRVPTALAAINGIGKIANSKPIEYKAEDVAQIKQALTDAVEAACDYMSTQLVGKSKGSEKPSFEIKE